MTGGSGKESTATFYNKNRILGSMRNKNFKKWRLNKIKKLFFAPLLLLLSPNLLVAQNREICVTSIEIDSKPISTNYKVYFSSSEKGLIKAKRTKDGFIVPGVVDLSQNQTVIFAFKKYRLAFSNLKPSDFDTKWKIGIDLEPFESELVGMENPQNIEIIYFADLSFGGRGSKIVVRVDRQPK